MIGTDCGSEDQHDQQSTIPISALHEVVDIAVIP